MVKRKTATQLEQDIAKAFGISVKMLRFHALRMIVELDQEKQISKKEQIKLYNKCSSITIQEVFVK